MYDINTMPGYISIGNQRDFGHTVQFDLTAWADLNADDWKITYTRPGEAATYPVPDGDVSVADNILTWTISEAVTWIGGTGSVIIEAYRGGEMLKHSARIMTIIGEGHEPAGEAPDPVQDWIDDATSKLAEVDHFVDETIAATEAANEAAGLTTDAIARANAISEMMEGIAPKWAAVDISVSALSEGTAPTASITQDETGTSITLGIPKGDTGAQGIQGAQGEQGEVGPQGEQGVQGPKGDLYAPLWRKTTANPAVIYPVPESPMYTRISGLPVQDGTGDPSPENIRPIRPWLAQGDAVQIRQNGKNIFDGELEPGDINGTAGANVNSENLIRSINHIPVVPLATYTISRDKRIGNLNFRFYDKDKAFISVGPAVIAETASLTFTLPSDVCFIRFRDFTNDLNVKIQLELGPTATPYEPYTADDITLTAPQEIPAGWMDNEGNGQITHGYIASYVDDETVPDGWVSSIGELSAGAQVVYPLATPIDITPTAAPLASLAQVDRVTPRSNVLTASTGQIELTYAKSPIQESNEIRAAIALI